MGNSFCLAVCGATCTRPEIDSCPPRPRYRSTPTTADPVASTQAAKEVVAAAALEIRASEPTRCIPTARKPSKMPTFYGGATPPY